MMSNSKPEFSSTTSWLPSKVCELSCACTCILITSCRVLPIHFSTTGEYLAGLLATLDSLVQVWRRRSSQRDCAGRTGDRTRGYLAASNSTGVFTTFRDRRNIYINGFFQLIARIQTSSPNIQNTINVLLTEVGKAHPQALIYSLTVASKSTNIIRQRAAGTVMSILRQHSPHLVEQVSLTQSVLYKMANFYP
jgi:hypothetical protein